MKTKLLTFLFACMTSISVVFADASGTCGDNLTWSYNSSTGTLTITGSGAMTDWSFPTNKASWYLYCSEIKTVNLPDGLTRIGDWAFEGCTGLTSVTIPNSVTSIGTFAFSGSTSLTSVAIPNSVTSIGGWAFDGCTGLTAPVYNSHFFAFMPRTYSGAYSIPDGIETIAGGAFQSCSGLTSITIPNSVTSIGTLAFSGSTSLTSVTIPNSVTSIGNMAFFGCSGLTSITIPNSVTSIGEDAFRGTSLTSVTIPNSVTSIGDWAFRDCTGLQYIIYAGTATGSPWGASCSVYAAKDGWLLFSDVEKTQLIKCLPDATGSITIPNSVTSIGDYAFYHCSGLQCIIYVGTATGRPWGASCGVYAAKDGWLLFRDVEKTQLGKCLPDATGSITIPNSVTSIEKNAFSGCSGLTSIRVEQGNTKYDSRDNCNAIIETATNTLIAGCQNTVIPNSVTSIGEYAFSGCSGLTSVVLGNGVKTIGSYAFSGCTGLQSITCYSMRPPTVTNGSQTAQFATLPYSTIVYVPADYFETYMMHDIWGLYDVRPIGSTTVQTTDLMVTPHYTTADVAWPTVDNAATYELVITQNGTVVCTLVFNAQGQLTSIAFRAPAESASAAGQGFQFTVTGLEDGSAYSLTLNAKDAAGNVLRTFAQDFSTGATALEDVNADDTSLKPRKVIEDGRVIILMPDGRKFDANGRALGK